MRKTLGRALWRALRRAAAALMVAAVLASSTFGALDATPRAASAQIARDARTSYVVRVGQPATLQTAGRLTEPTSQAHDQVKTDLAELLGRLAESGAAGTASYDAALDGFRVDLTADARARLTGSRLVGAVEPAASARTGTAAPAASLAPASPTRGAQAVGSVSFVQVYTPFVWGRTNFGGLGVELTLENSRGQVKGIAAQKYQTAPNDYVKIDRAQLYFETLFKDPNDATHQKLAYIMPGDRVHVVTSGVDPGTGATAIEDKRIVVDDLQAWTSYEQDTVSGIGPPGSDVTVTVGAVLWLASYITPGNQVYFRDMTSDASGRFSVGQFQTSGDPTPRKLDLTQGSTGYVRVKHSDGNEVYTVHGQNVLVLENSAQLHGYAFGLPISPMSVDPGVALLHPGLPLSVTLKNAAGGVKETWSVPFYGSYFPYQVAFTSALIAGGDSLDVSIGAAPPRSVATSPLNATVDVSANQIRGTGPPGADLTILAGRTAGYMTASSYIDFLSARVTSDGGGAFASGTFGCGTNGRLTLGPGSFGMVGYEDARGNFIYEAIAAPSTQAMVDYPFVEGWLPDGAQRPTLTVRGADGATKHSSTVKPTAGWLGLQRLWINVYYNAVTTEYIVPGDIVTLDLSTGAATIPVDRVTGYVNVDSDTVVGDAPAGVRVRVIPKRDRWSYRLATADATGRFTASTPFKNVLPYNCTEQDQPEDFGKAESGRVYLQRADGNGVFAHFGRAMWIDQNGQDVEVWPFVYRDLDWFGAPPARSVKVTVAPRDGSAPVTLAGPSEMSDPGHVRVDMLNAQGQRVIVRAGDTVTASFDEGPNTLKRTVSLTVASQPIVLAVPDVDSNTIAGVGPRGWDGGTSLPIDIAPYLTGIAGSARTAWGPLGFRDSQKKVIPIARGYAGTVAFTNPTGTRIWSAWAAVALPTKIVGYLNPGDVQVCGTGAPNASLRIHDLSSDAQDVILGTGRVDSAGKFCAAVPPLVKDQVILAEADGTYSQPVLVGSLKRTFIAFSPRAQRGF